MRSLIETIIGLAIAVSLVRGLATEGYMISTGSMAPTLLGYHRHAECPHCQFEFTRGSVPRDFRSPAAVRAGGDDDDLGTSDEATPTESDATEQTATPPNESESVVCPNCGTGFTTASPRTEGDQLLVFKHIYRHRLPRRWEVVVFRNPSDPAEAYIKRVAGLPGETIAIREGDVWADGRLCRKPASVQRAMRLPVASLDHPTGTPSRWRLDGGWLRSGTGDGTVELLHDGPPSTVTYHHRLRSGGEHISEVALPQWPTPHPPNAARLQWHQGRLHCRGVLPDAVRDGLLGLSPEATYQAAIRELATASRASLVTDACGYNRPGGESFPVRDLAWSGRVELGTATSTLVVRLLYGRQPFALQLTPTQARLLTLGRDGSAEVLGEAAVSLGSQPALVELSVIDRQVVVALDGRELLPPLPFAASELTTRPSRTPLTLTAAGSVRLREVMLWRDVYVTPPDSPIARTLAANGEGPGDQPSGELFLLGDNSPVSVDSRRWPTAAIPVTCLIGKPYLVHLPSRQVSLGDWGPVRLPDVGRIRWVQ